MLGHKIIIQITLNIISALMSFIASIFVAKAFLPETIGEIAFIVGICSLATMFFDFGLNQTTNTKIAQQKTTPESNLVALIYFKLILTLVYIGITLTVFFANKTKISNIGIIIFIIISISLYIENISTSLQQYFTGQKHFYKYMLNNFFAQLGGSVFLILISIYYPTKFNYVMATFIRVTILISVSLYFLRNIKIDWSINRNIINDHLKYVKPLLISTPLFFIISNVEDILLPYLISSYTLGIFIFGLKFYNLAELIKRTFTNYIYTYVCNIVSSFYNQELFERLNNLIIITQIFATILVVGIINRTNFLIILFFGNEYAKATIITQIMCLLVYFELITSNYFHIIYSKAIHHKLNKWILVSGLILIVSIIILVPQSFFGIKLFGWQYAGLPIAKLIRVLFLGVIISVLLVKKEIGRAFIFSQLKFFIFFLLYLLMDYFLLQLQPQMIIWVFASWALGIAIYLIIIIKFFINHSIQQQFKKLLDIKTFKEGLQEN